MDRHEDDFVPADGRPDDAMTTAQAEMGQEIVRTEKDPWNDVDLLVEYRQKTQTLMLQDA